MAWERPVLILPAQLAGEDMSVNAYGYQGSAQFLFVKQNPARDADTVVTCTSVKDRPRGVLQNNPESGEAAAVMSSGVTKVVAGATVSPGDQVGTDAHGRCVRKNETSTGANYGDFIKGECLEGGAVGDLITVNLDTTYRI